MVRCDFRKDLISVQNLQKKHGLLESDINAHQERIDGVTQQARQFEEGGHFDAANIRAKERRLIERYTNLQDPLRRRRAKLAESVRGQQLFRDIDDELAWIREKEQIAASTNRGNISERGKVYVNYNVISFRSRLDRRSEFDQEAPGIAGRIE